MKIISLFNNKGGVGKTTLAFHLSHSLSEMGYKVLMIDADPQCNLTISSLFDDKIAEIWEKEDQFIEDFKTTKEKIGIDKFDEINSEPRTIHYLLKTTEEGTGDLEVLPPPVQVTANLGLIPGRLSMHMYEDKIAERWNGVYRGDPLSIRTITKIRSLAEDYGSEYGYDFAIIDTSPSLGILNKVIISTVDGFLIPCLPDMFSLYGIRNIGDYLSRWKKEFETIYSLISNEKRAQFPSSFVSFLGFTIYNAKKYTAVTPLDLAQAHYSYALQIPETVKGYIQQDVRAHLDETMLSTPIGGKAIMHTHNTLPNITQKYKNPMWKVPSLEFLEQEDIATIRGGSRATYEGTRGKYIEFTEDLLLRIGTLEA
ncbi:ParA family protein [Tumebacillus permanentifrigoris]|uniref:AAA domain-containing protein n=1 Tax=Tumebacillus permanentifrigoris TaxID=378543 RepID=A0A316DCC0_9BACL|nr:AAA family ATPase [Tumebacillus permanentifrigoris]PWK14937.1 AAA domain-containing protein [Tumebacillus permanentifrigoris]